MIKPVKHSTFEGIICDKDPHDAPSISRLYYSFIASEHLSVFRVNMRRPSSRIYIAFSEIMRCLQQTNYSPPAPKRNKWSLTAVKNISGFDDNFRFGEKPTVVLACLFKNAIYAVAICPAAGHSHQIDYKCPAVKHFHQISPESLSQTSWNNLSLLRNVKHFQKLFWPCSWWDIFAWAYYEIALTLTLRKCSARPRRQWPQSESVTEFPLLSSYKRLESIRCSFRNVKRFQKSFWFFSWRNVWAWAQYKFGAQTAGHGLKWTKCAAVGNFYHLESFVIS